MNFEIVFSTYNNKTQTQTNRHELEKYLVAMASTNKIQGFSLTDQLGYWAGELEQSHVLTLLDINKEQAFSVANQIKMKFEQQAVIVKPVQQQVYFI